MHQAFEQYARGLGKKLQDEWLKIQGRFESIAFLEAAEQTLHVLKATFRHRFNTSEYPKLQILAQQIAEPLYQVGALPGSLDIEQAAELFYKCYPLHPIALLLLPQLCQKVAQNERTLFSYIGSREAYSFQERLAHLNIGDWIQAADIYDYFLLNQPTALTDSFTYHHWVEVITALERLGSDAPPEQIKLLKTIGLLNIVGGQGGFKASQAILALSHPEQDASQQEQNLKALQAASCIHFRSFSQEYRVWQGSDFDLSGILVEETNALRGLNLAETLNQRQVLAPLVARRHTIESGSLRYFIPSFIDSESVHKFQPDTQQLQIYFYLAADTEEQKIFEQLLEQVGDLVVMVFCPNLARLHDSVIQVMGLVNMAQHHTVLQTDPVAEREHKAWLSNAHANEQKLLNNFLETPCYYSWYWRGKACEIPTKRRLQITLSEICDTIYYDTPIIRNELINRTQISGSASTGRNKLFNAMLEHAAETNLGITKFPAEKSMYLALLKEPGLHRQAADGRWLFSSPDADNPFKFHKLWQAIDRFLDTHETQAQALTALYAILQKPPYGLKNGILPVLFAAYYLSRQREIALYEENIFCPLFTYEHLELLSKRPERFSIERFRLQGMRLEVFRHYLQNILGHIPEQATLLDIIRPLAKFMRGLPVYTQKTNNLSPETLAVRNSFNKAQSPAKLLFQALPQACGFTPFEINSVDETLAKNYMEALLNSLRELKGAYQVRLDELRDQLAYALKLPEPFNLPAMRQTIQERFTGLEQYTGGEGQDLFAFIRRLTSLQNKDQAWLESVGTLLGRIPPNKWQESHSQQAELKLKEFRERLHDVAALDEAIKNRPNNQTRTVLIRAVSQDKGEQASKIAYINEAQEQQVKQQVRAVQKTLKGIDKSMGLAVIAELLEGL
ncbi:hypothetical protein QUF61_04735 [Candidatus Venteria ishoeyi]|uniref:hypothetical protein n=1 Tax=Candidatus Venteria ishoeyi TaxID=1899563 RepID=UPI0025A4F24A|nr:hypothetical protein [Candidatus Venteria ishoeyi]MDM8545775.1 hypothetical protein [Candidatus Venteria ishoeyi]